MIEPSNPAVAAALQDPRRIDEAMRLAAVEAVIQHARAGRSIPVAQSGKVIWLTPAEVLAQLGQKANNPAA